MPDPSEITTATAAGPYAAAASLYRSLGWAGVLPVVGKHDHLPAGYTGRRGAWPDDVTVGGWVAGRGGDNVALRVPPDVIGIDVDAYDGRVGLQTLETFAERFGDLPATWTCSARRDGSGIRFYRVPAGLVWVGDLGTGSNVEVIQTAHRYAVVAPSVHPGNHPGDPVRGEPYRWTDPAGSTSATPPAPADLPELPAPWVAGLRRDSGVAPGEPDGRSHRQEDGEFADYDGQRVDPHLLLHGEVPPGEQQNRLFSYLCSLRARNAHRDEMVLLGLAAMTRFANADAADPWSPEHVTEMVDRVRDEYAPGSSSAAAEVGPELLAWARAVGTGAASVEERPEAAPNATDTGNAARFARLYADELRYVADEGHWYRWDGRRWATTSEVEVLHLTAAIPDLIRADGEVDAARRDEWGRWAARTESVTSRSAIVRLGATRPELRVGAGSDFDTNPDLLVVENGTLDLRTGELRPSRREDLCSQLAAVRFDPAADAPRWRQAAWDILNRDVEAYRYAQRALGYTLTGHVGERAFFFLRGDGRNGKNTLVEPVLRLLGTYGVASNAKLFGGQEHDTVVANLRGRRLVFVDELPDRRSLNVERLKTLTGSERISARFIAGNPFEFVNRMKLWLTCNGDPPVTDDSSAVWDRMHLVECPVRFGGVGGPESVRGLAGLLYAEEAPGILNWLLDGVRAWRQLEELAPPAGVRRAVEEYRGEEQHLDRWVTETLAPGDPEVHFLANEELASAWRWWAATNGVPRSYVEGVTPHKLGHALRRRGYGSAVTNRNGRAVRGRSGVRWAENSGSGVTDRPEGPPT